METNRNDKERNEGSSWENESQHMGSQNKSYGYNEEERNSENQNMSGHDAGTGSSMQNQGMGSRGNEMNDPASRNDPDSWGSDSNRMSGRSDSDENRTWDSTGGDTYSTRQENSGRSVGDESGEENMRLSGSERDNDWNSRSMSSREGIEDDFNSGSGSQSMSGRNNDINDDWDGRSSSQSMSGRNNETDDWNNEGGHNMSSGSAYLEEDVDRASRDMSGSRDHDYMENNGNSMNDYNLTSDLNDDWDESRSQSLSGRDTDFDGGSHSQEMSSDSDDFYSSDFEDEDKALTDRRSSDAKTFNEDEDTWRHEQRMKGREDEAGSGANYGQDLSNRGTSNNNWDATDQTQRGREWHDDEDEKNSLF